MTAAGPTALRGLLVAALAVTSGCDKSEHFVGTWRYSIGSTTTVDCGTDGPLHGVVRRPDTGDVSVVAGSRSDIVVITADGCQLELDVVGGTATATTGPQDCSLIGLPVTEVTTRLSVTSATMTVRYDKQSMSLVLGGTAAPDGFAETCTFGAEATASKVAD